jgi:hypothetical protein
VNVLVTFTHTLLRLFHELCLFSGLD